VALPQAGLIAEWPTGTGQRANQPAQGKDHHRCGHSAADCWLHARADNHEADRHHRNDSLGEITRARCPDERGSDTQLPHVDEDHV